MNLKNWFRLSFFEQLSNIAGEVKRLVDNHEDYLQNTADDYSEFYMNKIIQLIDATFEDEKNDIKRKKELIDEYYEISHYLEGKVSAQYILNYWNQYTKAISF